MRIINYQGLVASFREKMNLSSWRLMFDATKKIAEQYNVLKRRRSNN